MRPGYDRQSWRRWHRLTNRHILIIPDAGGEIRFCLRRFPRIGVADGVTYQLPGSPYRSLLMDDQIPEIIRCKSAWEVRVVLGMVVSPGEIIKEWADEHDPEHRALNELFFGDTEKVNAILADRELLTPDDIVLLSCQTDISCVRLQEQQDAYRQWMSSGVAHV